MATYDSVRALPLHIDGYYLEPLEREVAREFKLRRTVIVLHGRGEEGRGEEVDYDPAQQARFQEHGGKMPLAGEHSLESFSLLQSGQTEYRRWGLESAALDLALRQAGLSLGEAVGRVVAAGSLRGLDPRDQRAALARRSTPSSGSSSIPAATGRTRSSPRSRPPAGSRPSTSKASSVASSARHRIRRSTVASSPRSRTRGSRILLSPRETSALLAEHRERVTWDAGIHEWTDVEALPFPPRALNCKPSRFGSVKRLFDFYDACEQHGIALYGGGQYELGPGRAQIQLLASLFHPDAPNDVAPDGFNVTEPVSGLPGSPLSVGGGFGRTT